MTKPKETPTYEEVDFHPGSLNGLAVKLKTELGLFYIFSITEDLSEIDYYYSKTGDDEDLVEACEIDLEQGEGFYEKTKLYLIDILKEFKLDERASSLFEEWRLE